jgi:nucleoporin NUP159
MVDTVALNARSLQGFVEGNNQQQSAHDKSRLDLEQDHDWLLGEARQLDGVVQGIETQLHDGRLTDVRGALANVQEDENELTKLRAKSAEARKHIMARRDPDQLAQQYAAPLPMETQTLQMELRRETQNVQKLLAKAEEQLTVLRAELASLPSAQGADGRNGSGMPTVEAVEKTIRRMTQMIEQKSGDINVLESQIRKLGGPAALAPASNYEDDLVAGMKASRISRGSPAAMRSSQLRTSAYGSPTMSRRGRSSRSGTPGTPGARRSLFDVGEEEVEAYRAKREGRRVVLEELRDRVQQKGVRVVRVGE